MNQLETLLNTLIARGWKPWELEYFVDVLASWTIVSFSTAKWATSPSSLRELVSLESWLWQFVCENKLYKEHNGKIERYFDFNEDDYLFHYARDFRYRLIESALVSEDKLEKFLLDNIIVEWNSK